MASSFVVSGLTNYIETEKDVLIRSAVIGRTPNYTLDKVSKKYGIKTSDRINYLELTPVLQDGKGCGFSASGSTEFSERDIVTAIYKVNDEWCPDQILGKFAENQVAIAAGKERLPFEQEISNEIVDGVADQVERLIWQGATSANSGTDLIDGFLTQALNDDSASTIMVTGSSATSVYNQVKAVYMALPEEMLNSADAFIGLSPAMFRQYVQELVTANLYHYNPGDGDLNEMFIPGAGIKVVKIKGLTGSNKIYASVWKNLVAGMDMMNDSEEFKLWFSDDADLFRLKLKFNIGVKTYFPDAVVVGDFSA